MSLLDVFNKEFFERSQSRKRSGEDRGERADAEVVVPGNGNVMLSLS